DGSVEFQGRADYQVKIRGYRIELGEIEAALQKHPSVREAVVVAGLDGAGQPQLIAYVVQGTINRVSHDDLRVHIRQKLPEYMVPAAIVSLDVIPRLPSGKLDRRALPEPGQANVERAYLEPRTPVAQLLAGVWAQLLQADRVSADDDFFALG